MSFREENLHATLGCVVLDVLKGNAERHTSRYGPRRASQVSELLDPETPGSLLISVYFSRRVKLSNPNHSQWADSGDGYGQKILSAHGWRPGTFLGAPNANHAGLYTAANASHIRISFKDDNLGLGANLQSNALEHNNAGFDAFQGLLGRLNGKSDNQLATEQAKRDDHKLARYAGGRWKSVTFVYGGTLIQEKLPESCPSQPLSAKSEDKGNDALPTKGLSKAERKATRERRRAEKHELENDLKESKSERRKRRKRRREESPSRNQAGDSEIDQCLQKKHKRRKDRAEE